MGSGGGIRAAVAEINVTPLIDVLLVLLIIFMVILPQVPNGLNAQVPQPPKSLVAVTPPETIVVQVQSSRSGSPTYKINEDSFAKSAIKPKLQAIFAARQDKVMFVKGDPELIYGDIAEVIDLGHQAGVETIGIVTPGVQGGQ
jgi:biopolymer transport protein ExbD/biopolymer transport protein TolR